jgi:hypothetical protein
LVWLVSLKDGSRLRGRTSGISEVIHKKVGHDFPGETFRVLKEKEEKKYGEYRTRHLKIDEGDVFGIFRYSTEYYLLKIET